MVRHRVVGLLFLCLAMIAVGSTVIASKLIAGGLPPFSATVLRFAIAAPVFVLIALVMGLKLPRISLHDWTLLVLQAGLGSVGYTVLLILGMGFTTGANASVVVGTLPIVMGVFAVIAFKETLTRRFLIALVTCLAGVALVTFQGSGLSGFPSASGLIGITFILLAVICEAVFMLMNKKLHRPLPAITQAGLMSGLGLSIALIPAAFEVSAGKISGLPPEVLLSVAYYAIVPTLIGSTLWYAGALRTSASDAALTTAIMPVAALGLSVLVLGEGVSQTQLIGCLLVVCAILIGASKGAQPAR